MSQDTPRSVPDLLSDLVSQTSTLLRKEIQLARAELSEKASLGATAGASIGAGALLMLAALIVLLQAAVAALVEYVGLSATVSALIVALVVAVIGYVTLRSGLKVFEAASLTPTRTVTQLSRDADVVKERLQ